MSTTALYLMSAGMNPGMTMLPERPEVEPFMYEPIADQTCQSDEVEPSGEAGSKVPGIQLTNAVCGSPPLRVALTCVGAPDLYWEAWTFTFAPEKRCSTRTASVVREYSWPSLLSWLLKWPEGFGWMPVAVLK